MNTTNKQLQVSYNANSRNRRKILKGNFQGNGSPSQWTKTTDFGSYKHVYTPQELSLITIVRYNKEMYGRNHAGSKHINQLYGY